MNINQLKTKQATINKKRPKILVVEDQKTTADVIEYSLQNLDYTVSAVVSSGIKAIEQATQNKPDLILMDINLGEEIDGIDSALQIKKLFDIPIVYLTARSDPDAVQRAKITAPYGYIIKPFTIRELQISLEMALYRHKMEFKLKEKEQWLQTTLNSIGDGVIATNIEGHITFINPIAESLTGWLQKQALTKNLSTVLTTIHEETHAPIIIPITKVCQQGCVLELDPNTLLITKNKTEKAIAGTIAPIKDTKNTVTGMVLAFRDITPQKQAQKQLILLEEKIQRELDKHKLTTVVLDEQHTLIEAIFESIPDAVIVINTKYEIIMCNPSLQTLFGYTAEEIIGKHNKILYANEEDYKTQNKFSLEKNKEDIKLYQTNFLCKNGKQFIGETIIGSIKNADGIVIGFVNIIRDISQRKQIELKQEQLLTAEREQHLLAEAHRKVTLALASHIHFDAVLDEVLEQSQQLVPCNACNIMLLNGNMLYIARWHGYINYGNEAFISKLTQSLTNMPIETEVVKTQQPYIVKDTQQAPNWVTFDETAWIRSTIVLPISLRDRVLGILRLDSDTPHHFKDDVLKRLKPLTTAAAIALENTRIYDRARQEIAERKRAKLAREKLLNIEREQRLQAETLAEVTLALTAQTEHSAVLDEILSQTYRLVPYRTAHIMLLEDNSLNVARWQRYQEFEEASFFDEAIQPINNFQAAINLFKTHRYLIIQDTTTEQQWAIFNKPSWSKSILIIPIYSRDQLLGLLRLDDNTPQRFSNKDAQRLLPLTNAASAAIENARLLQQMQLTLTQAQVLYQATCSLIAPGSLTELLQAIVDDVVRAISADNVILATINLKEKQVIHFVVGGPAANKIDPLSFDELWDGLTGWVLCKLEPVLSSKYNLPDPRENVTEQQRREKNNTGSVLVVPVHYQNKVLGTITALNHQNHPDFTDRDIELVVTMANQAAVAIENARLFQALRKSEERLRNVVSNAPIILWALNQQGIFTLATGKELNALGYKSTEIVGQSVFDIYQDSPLFLENIKRALAGDAFNDLLEINNQVFETWYSPLWAETSPLWAETSPLWAETSPLWDETSPLWDEKTKITGVIVIATNVTERKHLEEQLREVQKMEAIGRLAGSIAHDFNNILTVILGHSELLLHRDLDDKDRLQEGLYQIKETGEQAARLTRQLLSFSRRHPLQTKLLNLNTLIIGHQEMLHHLIGERIELIIDLYDKLGFIEADPIHIEQVILNLIVNARDAMPNGGKLTIKTANINLDKTYNEYTFEVIPGPYVMLSITDTGLGIAANIQPHIFEPFFTTKESGYGTGLGLSTVYGIVRQSKGHIWVYSEVNQGTTFKVYFPKITQTNSENKIQPTPNTLPMGTETILLVEDEQDVRLITAKLLKQYGYTVLQAANAEDAFRISQHHNQPIDLLITDVILPNISGRELADYVVVLQPQIKVLYISGYTDEILTQHGIFNPGIFFLEKPFSTNALTQMVRQVLDKP